MIPQIQPWIDDAELEEVSKVIRSGQITEGEETKLFEEKMKKTCGARHAIAVANGTVALYMSLKAAGIGSGDEVIVPDFTFIASANAVLMAGGTPVFADVDRRTFNLDPHKAVEKITSRTKAIMPVHIYGQSADMDAIGEIAGERGLHLIEDAAQGIGVRFNKRHVGTFGELGCVSFYGNKTITTGEGGIILTDDDKLALACFKLKNHGRPVKGIFTHESVGYNFSFTDLQAAVGVAQLSKLDRIIEKKERIRRFYVEELENVQQLEFTYVDPRCSPVFWFTSILVEDPKKLSDHLLKKGIGTRRFFYPLHRQPCYEAGGSYPNSDYAYEHGISLPSSALITDEDLKTVCEEIKRFYR